ncbi:dnaJ homolog subfamily C member 14-like isoform X2 [Amphiura filiformis]|uniref:dnaJ homolog subfamily C member 14-like isoform X2 n=1 Tax=Amphiura filiformis TaxID=82378 RepID=UPI003B21D22A
MTAYLFSTCKVWIEYILHILNELWKSIAEILGFNDPNRSLRWWNSWPGWFKKSKDDSHGHSHHGSDGCGCKKGRGKHAEFVELPLASSEAIARIMACDPDDAYAVLGVGDAASDDDIKKYYRKQCVMVHPDKCNLRHANDAFQMLQKGYETLTDPVKRYDLDRQRASACEAEDMLNDIYEKMKEAMNTLNCNMCDNKHKRYPVERPCYAARYCSRHDTLHGATEGDMWAETTHLGFKWHYYACMDDEVFDITEWAKCQNLRHMESNCCEVRYRIGSNRRRHPGSFRPADEAPVPPWQQFQPGFEEFRNGDEELDDLLRHLFGDRASRTANDPRSSGQQNTNRTSSNRKRRHRKKKY